MAGITNINRITGSTNNIVYCQTDDSTATAIASGYITAQADNITTANNGAWTWEANDVIFLSASDGDSICTIDSAFTTLSQISSTVDPYALHMSTFSLTAAQFNGMYAAPVSVLAAPGAGKLLLPQLILMEMDYGGAAFASGGVVGFQYGNTAQLAGTIATTTEAAADFFQTADTVFKFAGSTGNSSFILASLANSALHISNLTGAFTTGTSTFSGTIFYRVLSV